MKNFYKNEHLLLCSALLLSLGSCTPDSMDAVEPDPRAIALHELQSGKGDGLDEEVGMMRIGSQDELVEGSTFYMGKGDGNDEEVGMMRKGDGNDEEVGMMRKGDGNDEEVGMMRYVIIADGQLPVDLEAQLAQRGGLLERKVSKKAIAIVQSRLSDFPENALTIPGIVNIVPEHEFMWSSIVD